jgi:hypothetical protein
MALLVAMNHPPEGPLDSFFFHTAFTSDVGNPYRE